MQKIVTEDDDHVIHGPPPLFPFPKVSLGRLLFDALSGRSTKPALVDGFTGDSISFRELFEASCSLAKALQNQGYCKDSVFSIISENSLQFYIPVLSSLYLGATMATINNNYTVLELEHTLSISKPTLVFCSTKTLGRLLQIKGKLSFISKIIVIDSSDNINEAESLSHFIGNNSSSGDFCPVEIDPQQQTALILCSSGTTGLPKGVMLTHSNFCTRFWHTINPYYYIHHNAILCILPFFHGYGFTITMAAIWLKETVVMLKQFDENVFLKSIQDYKIRSLYLIPQLALFLAKTPLLGKYDLSSVQEVLCGSAPLSKDVEESIKQRLGISNIRQGYGLTECTLATILVGVDDYKLGSVGKVVTYMSCKVRDPETGKSLGPNEVGEICFKGPMVMKGYFKNEEATKNTFTRDGWMLTGDLGYYDENQYFFIVDRLKELIKYKGYQVAPAEIEAILLTNSKIRDAGVVGIPDDLAGELPTAFIVKNQGVDLTEAEVEKFISDRVSPQKKLRGGVIFITEIPRNASGKIVRRELRNLANQYKSKL